MSPFPLSALVVALVSGAGLLIHSTVLRTGAVRAGMFCFYTNLSNLLVLLYELSLFTARLLGAGAVYALLAAPDTVLAVTACIWVTHLIYHFVLVPYTRRNGTPFADSGGERVGNALVHYVTPLLVLLQWLLWADKFGLNVWSAVKWLVIPLAYFVFAMLRARTGKPIGHTKLLYPYPFLDRPGLGAKKFWLGVVELLLGFFVLGLILVAVGRWLG
ncbi:MAG: hypothetical protein E7426_04710 [Ruminococcaceae bacterium]|jgi:hypothetical protein|nr:hypothetical protein [Oscillospiraceae bacterium]